MMIELTLRAPGEVRDSWESDGVHGAPDRHAEKPVRNMHESDFHGSTLTRSVLLP